LEFKFQFARTEIVNRIHQAYFCGIRQMGIKDTSFIDKINPTFITLTTTAIHHCQLAMKSGKSTVPPEFSRHSGGQHNCYTRSNTQAVDNWRTDVFHCLDVHFRPFSPKVPLNNIHNIRSMNHPPIPWPSVSNGCNPLEWFRIRVGTGPEPLEWALLALAMVPDRHFGSGSGSKPNRCQIGSPGRQSTRTAHSGTIPW
jgi:hypothetical protein